MKKDVILEDDLILDQKTILLEADLGVQDTTLNTELSFGTAGGTKDYRKLNNKPTINGTELYDNYNEIDPTVPDWAKKEVKPEYTAEEVGAVDEENIISKSKIDLMFLKIFG